jgi:hypothetical protein
MRAVLEGAIRQYDANGKPRRVIIVAQRVAGELSSMYNFLGIDLTNREKFPSIIGILDTCELSNRIAHQADTAFVSFKLQGVLETFGIPHAFLHIAGNDANFTLKALLMLFVQDFQKNDKLKKFRASRLADLKSIAQASIGAEMKKRYESNPAFEMRKNNQQLDHSRRRSHPTSFPAVLSGQDGLNLLKGVLLPERNSSGSISEDLSPLFVSVNFRTHRDMKLRAKDKDVTQILKILSAGFFCTVDTEMLN